MQHSIFGLQILEKCNFFCSHCITKSSLRTNYSLSYREIERAISGVVDMGINKVCISGGEPILEIENCVRAINLIAKNGLEPSLISNGFWGEDCADDVMKNLFSAGLKRLGISYDSYHRPFINFQSIVNISKAARKSSINLTILFCYDHLCILDEDEEYKKLKMFCEESRIDLKTSIVLPLGRGAQLYSNKNIAFDDIIESRCDTVARPSLIPGGNLNACCVPAIEASKSSPLMLGNIHEEPVFELLKRGANNIILNAIHTLGIKKVLSMLSLNTQKHIISNSPSASECSVCRLMTDNADVVAEMYSVLEPIRWKIFAMATMISKQREVTL